jgi:hypothetical protein
MQHCALLQRNLIYSLRRQEIALGNLDRLLENEGFDSAAYFQKRKGFLLEMKALDQKLKDMQDDLDGIATCYC